MSEVGAGIDPEATAEIPTTASAEYEAEQPLAAPSPVVLPMDGAEDELADRDPSRASAPYQQHDDEDQLTSGFDVTNFVGALPAPGYEDVLSDGAEESAAAEGEEAEAPPAPGLVDGPAGKWGVEGVLPAGEAFEDPRPFGPALDEILPDETGFEGALPDETGFEGALPDEAGFEGALPDEAGAPGSESGTSQLIFVDVLIVLPSSNPVVVLQEADAPYRELRIPIGGPEGIAIGYAARRIATPRPLTHELMSLILRDFDLTLEVVRITGCSGGSFTAEIVLSGPSGVRTIDCRPSDAIALALRQRLPVPIVATADVIEQAGSGAAGSN